MARFTNFNQILSQGSSNEEEEINPIPSDMKILTHNSRGPPQESSELVSYYPQPPDNMKAGSW